ncbi:MAG: ion channel [Candidatus Nanopelagicales bacterium]|nr:ion channel [Candidatus Nanopelagicales bacterium]MCH1463682.1 ion channel [Candidatus Nanopelagicales bacterium]MCH9707516.1 ion transporter [Actinomycetes bacterium]
MASAQPKESAAASTTAPLDASRMDRVWAHITDNKPDPGNPRQVRAQGRLDAYEHRTALAMVLLAVGYLVLYSFYVLDEGLTSQGLDRLDTAMNVIWVVFIADLTLRTVLAPKHIAYLVHHPLDVIAVAVPAFRVLRVLRVLTAGQWLISRGSRLRFGRTATAVVFAVAFLTYLSSLAVLNAERGAQGADIKSFGDAVWWSLVTMATVGYGDYVPVTANGRIVAVGLMVVGISLLGLVGASVASAVVTRIGGRAQEGQSEVKKDLEALRTEIAALRQALLDAGVSGTTQPSPTDSAPPASPATPAHRPSLPE